MPHCVLEYSDNITDQIEYRKLFAAIHQMLAETGMFSIADIKSRAVKHEKYFVGDGEENRGFATLSLSILSGRDEKIKKELSDKCLNILNSYFHSSLKQLKFSLTVQIKEIDKNSYGKIVSY